MLSAARLHTRHLVGASRAAGVFQPRPAFGAGPVSRFATLKQWLRSAAPRSEAISGTAPFAGSVAAAPSTAAPAVDKAIGYWLGGLSGMVFSMVVLGGVTRLTRSGLSMTDWRPQEEWEAEFEKYKLFPEYQRLNMHMTLEEFKVGAAAPYPGIGATSPAPQPIYWMEYMHRMWGRALGLAFVVPFAYFAARRRIPRDLYKRLGLMFAIGGGQGAVGWWMVRSGLEAPEHEWREPRVSPYRLTSHLTVAITLYSLLAWTSMDILRGAPKALALAEPALSRIAPKMARFRTISLATSCLLGVTVVSGAFVAGNDAGHAYNDFPFFAGRWLPEDLWDERIQPAYRRFFESTGLVQLDHRVLAVSTLLAVAGTFAAARRPRELWAALPAPTRRAVHALFGMAGVQVTLGVSTLMLYVPISLGALHQVGRSSPLHSIAALTPSPRPALWCSGSSPSTSCTPCASPRAAPRPSSAPPKWPPAGPEPRAGPTSQRLRVVGELGPAPPFLLRRPRAPHAASIRLQQGEVDVLEAPARTAAAAPVGVDRVHRLRRRLEDHVGAGGGHRRRVLRPVAVVPRLPLHPAPGGRPVVAGAHQHLHPHRGPVQAQRRKYGQHVFLRWPLRVLGARRHAPHAHGGRAPRRVDHQLRRRVP